MAPRNTRYFPISKIGKDQLADWAQRTGLAEPAAARWLAPLL